jgi:hypothetical protein
VRTPPPAASLRAALSVFALCAGCASASDHDELSDFDPVDGKQDGVAASFDRDEIMSDSFFTDVTTIGAAEMQLLLEQSPYGGRSWLADEVVGGRRASEVIVAEATRAGINPVLLVTRLQVEQSLVSRASRPPQSRIDRALGCGCPDGGGCQAAFRGFEKQMACGADTLRRWFDRSIDGTGIWIRNQRKVTSDGLAVTPRTHATASLYAYTPWVLVGTGGNWLVWNVTLRFMVHLADLGLLSGQPGEVGPWIGTPCADDDMCEFVAAGERGFCYDWLDERANEVFGFCTAECRDACAHAPGAPTSACVELDPGRPGCAAEAAPENDFCSAVPGTTARVMPSFSDAEKVHAVCVPPDIPGLACTAGSPAGAGECIDVRARECAGTLHEGECPGPNSIRCCTP